MKKILSLLLALALCFGLSVPVSAAGFFDVPAGHYAASAIDSCVSKGIASGFSNGTFKPGNAVTRAQFCVMLARAFYADWLKGFDTEENRALGWFVPASSALYNRDPDRGVLAETSFEDGYMNAAVMGQYISRYDMAQIMSCILIDQGGQVPDAQRTAAQGKIGDWFAVPEKYRYAVSTCYSLGILGGQSNGTFSGNSTMTRA